MKYVLDLAQPVSFMPKTLAEEILQNVRTILATRVGAVPLHREFGVSWEHIDKPIHIAQSLVRAEIIESIERWEPRAEVEGIEFSESAEDAMEGLMKPKITMNIGESNG